MPPRPKKAGAGGPAAAPRPQGRPPRRARGAGAHRAGVDPEGAGVDVGAVLALRVHQEQRAAEAAHEHALARRQHGREVDADAVRHADGRHARDGGLRQRQGNGALLAALLKVRRQPPNLGSRGLGAGRGGVRAGRAGRARTATGGGFVHRPAAGHCTGTAHKSARHLRTPEEGPAAPLQAPLCAAEPRPFPPRALQWGGAAHAPGGAKSVPRGRAVGRNITDKAGWSRANSKRTFQHNARVVGTPGRPHELRAAPLERGDQVFGRNHLRARHGEGGRGRAGGRPRARATRAAERLLSAAGYPVPAASRTPPSNRRRRSPLPRSRRRPPAFRPPPSPRGCARSRPCRPGGSGVPAWGSRGLAAWGRLPRSAGSPAGRQRGLSARLAPPPLNRTVGAACAPSPKQTPTSAPRPGCRRHPQRCRRGRRAGR